VRLIDLKGQTFGRLQVLERSGRKWLCQCGCGSTSIADGRDLRHGHTKSCGCLRRDPKPRAPQSIAERIKRRIDIDGNGCWNWTGFIHPNGYGCFSIGRRTTAVHRASYLEFVGPIPAGYDIDHLCRNRRCCNPAHLEAVTRAENVRRAPRPKYILKTHCVHGHPYDEANTGWRKDRPGARYCRACSVKSAFQQRKQKAA